MQHKVYLQRKKSSKKATPRHSSSESFHNDEEVILKEELEVDREEAEVYWNAMCNAITAPPEAPYPAKTRDKIYHSLPSRSSHSLLSTIWEFCHVPDKVEFQIIVQGDRADDSPEG